MTQLGLEAAHLAAERRLRDVEHHRRLAEAPQLGHVHEVFELFEVHGRPRSLQLDSHARREACQQLILPAVGASDCARVLGCADLSPIAID